MVDDRTRLINGLKSRLKQYFPLALEILGELDTELACQFLLRWDALEELQREEPQEVVAFYRLWKCRHPQLIEERLQKIAAAMPLVTDPAIIQSGRLMVQSLASQLLSLIEPLANYDRHLTQLMDQHADAEIFRSFPGAGPALAPRLLAAFGTDRQRLENAGQVQAYCGIAPVMVRSGRTCQVRRRWACNKFLRQTFHEFAGLSLTKSAWAKAYYDQLRARARNTRPRSAPWPSSGYASCFAVGRPEPCTTRSTTSSNSIANNRPYSSSWGPILESVNHSRNKPTP